MKIKRKHMQYTPDYCNKSTDELEEMLYIDSQTAPDGGLRAGELEAIIKELALRGRPYAERTRTPQEAWDVFQQ